MGGEIVALGEAGRQAADAAGILKQLTSANADNIMATNQSD
jgi:hypothetical protein